VKITVFGLTISSSWGNGHATPYRAIFRALHSLGHEVQFFEKDVPYYQSRRDFESCDYCDLTLYPEWDAVRRFALECAEESDVVIAASYLPDGRRICGEILDLDGPLRVFYDLDTPITLQNMKNGGVEYIEASQIPAFDLVLSFAGGPSLHALESDYGARLVRPLYGCVDPDVYARVDSSAEFACELSYMGTFSADRQPRLEELFLDPALRHPDRQFLLAGPLYPAKWRWPDNIRRIEHVGPRDHARFYSSSRVTLNITRGEMARNGWCPSGRFFEAAACGAPLITDSWEGLDSFLDPERDICVVATAADVEDALCLSDEDLSAMARNARERTLEVHTGAVRAAQLVRYLEEAHSKCAAKVATGEGAL
jgi:spore maturation protein CgeB